MRIALQGLTKAAGTNSRTMLAQLRGLFTDLESQINKEPNVNSRQDLKIPTGTKRNDVVINLYKGRLRIGIFDGKRVRYLTVSDLQGLQKHNTNYVGHKTGTTAFNAAITRTTHFPNSGDFGFYENTAGPTFHLIFNLNNVTQAVAM